MAEEMRELSNKTITENAADYVAKVWGKEKSRCKMVCITIGCRNESN